MVPNRDDTARQGARATAPVVLSEYGEEEISLAIEEALTLRSVAGRALSLSPSDTPGRWVLRAGSMVGTIRTPAVSVLIRPKVPAANLFHMLEAGGEQLPLGQESFEYDHSGDLVPAFATFYARHLERALIRGLPRRYDEREDRLVGVRGRIDLRRQVTAAGLPIPVACRFDEHTSDHQLTRILHAATTRLARLPGVAPRTQQALLRALTVFEDVGYVQHADLARPTTFSRLDAHFRQVEHLARLVLEASSLVQQAGAVGAATFVIDMNRAFESFVEDRLRRSLARRVEVVGQGTRTLDCAAEVRVRPDLLFRRGGVDVYVADAKYKLTSDGFARESDYYQLLAYCSALGLSSGLLVYCHLDGPPPAREIVVRNTAQRLRTAAVRLDGTPKDIDARLSALADDIATEVKAGSDCAGVAD